MHRSLLTASCLLFGSVWQLGCQPNEYVPPPPPTVTVAHPVEKEIVDYLEYTGTTEAIETVNVRARVKGFLESTHFEEGMEVEAGTLLYVIDPRPFQAELSKTHAALKLAEAQLEIAKADVIKTKAEAANREVQYRRGVKASKSGAVTASEIDNLRTLRDAAVAIYHAAQASVASAKAQISASQATLEQAELDLGYTQVKSPISGRAGRNLVDVGNLVGSGEATLLTSVVKYDPIYAYFTISELDLLQWMRQLRESSTDENPTHDGPVNRPVFLGLADEDGFPHEGVFDYADLTVDESTGTFLVRAKFPNPQRIIPPGAFVRIQVPMEEKRRMLIPERAVGRDQSGAYALVVNSEQVVEQRSLKLGRQADGFQVVHEGLTPNDNVVINGIQRARPGAKVNPRQADAIEPSSPTASPSQEPDSTAAAQPSGTDSP